MMGRSTPSGVPHALCEVCNLVMSIPGNPTRAHFACSRCGSTVHRRKPESLSRTWAYVIAAAICYIPANVYPIMTITSFGQPESNTIVSGVIFLFNHGMWPLAFIVFVASVVVPVLKLVGLTGLVISVQRKSRWRPRDRASLYRAVEMVGRWSMVDIYVVTVLVALVHLGSLASVEAETGAFFFGAVVVLTLLASQSFDPRLIWDAIGVGDE